MKTKQIIRTWYQNHVPTWETNNLVDDLFDREFLESLLAKESKPKKELLHGSEKERGECEHCKGTGFSGEYYCKHCDGVGKEFTPPTPPISEDKTVEGKIELPKNIRYLNSDLKRWTKEITEAVNILTSNAKTK